MRRATVERNAVRISATLPMPPISKTNVPRGLRTDFTPVKNWARVDDGRRIHWCGGDFVNMMDNGERVKGEGDVHA